MSVLWVGTHKTPLCSWDVLALWVFSSKPAWDFELKILRELIRSSLSDDTSGLPGPLPHQCHSSCTAVWLSCDVFVLPMLWAPRSCSYTNTWLFAQILLHWTSAKTKPVSFIYRSDRTDGNPSRIQIPLKALLTILVLSLLWASAILCLRSDSCWSFRYKQRPLWINYWCVFCSCSGRWIPPP